MYVFFGFCSGTNRNNEFPQLNELPVLFEQKLPLETIGQDSAML